MSGNCCLCSVPHDVSPVNISTGDPKCWQNKCLPGDPNYLVGANCVSVLIDHFWREQQLVCYWTWAHGPFSQFLCSGGGICTTLRSINSLDFSLMGWSVVPKNHLGRWRWRHSGYGALFVLFSISFGFSLPLFFKLAFAFFFTFWCLKTCKK